MRAGDRLVGTFSRADHPRLLGLVAVGVAVAAIGTALALTSPGQGSDLGTLGVRLAVVGTIAFVVGASGYVAFSVFERGFD